MDKSTLVRMLRLYTLSSCVFMLRMFTWEPAFAAGDEQYSAAMEFYSELSARLDSLASSKALDDDSRFVDIIDELALASSSLNAQSSPTSTHLRSMNLKLLLKTLATIHSRIDNLFDPADRATKCVVPPLQSRAPAGVSPFAIKDPKLRAEYEAAIRRNAEKSQRYHLQSELRQLRDRFPKRAIYPFIHVNYDESNVADQQELELLFKVEIEDERLRKQLFKELAEYRKRHLPGSTAERADVPK